MGEGDLEESLGDSDDSVMARAKMTVSLTADDAGLASRNLTKSVFPY
jgi:hypothetical protein